MLHRPHPGALSLLFVWALLVLPEGGWGSEAGEGTSQFHVRRWTTQEGLPQSRVACLKQTRDGYLWIGTWAGLARFNGISFTVFNRYNTPALANDAINGLAEDTEGTLWIATQDGLISFRDGNFQRIQLPGAAGDHFISRVVGSRSGGIWIQIGGQVARFANGRFSRLWRVEWNNWPSICSLVDGADGSANIFSDRSWLTISPRGEMLRTNVVEAGDKPHILAAWPAETAGVAWAGTDRGLRCLGTRQGNDLAANMLSEQPVHLIYQDPERHWWVGTSEGRLYCCSSGSWSFLDVELGTPICLEAGTEGNLWVGNDLGLAMVRRPGVRTYTTRDGLANNHVLSVCEGTDGAIWVGTDRGLSCIRDGKVSALSVPEPVPDYPDRSVCPGGDGSVFVSKPGVALFEFNAGGFTQMAAQAMLPGKANVVYRDLLNRLWLGGELGAALLDVNDPTRVVVVMTNDVRSVLQDRDGAVWFGTRKQGLARLQKNELKFFTKQDGLSDDRVWSLLQDAQGTLWIGTDNGFNRYRAGRFFAFTPRHGLPERTINCVLQDDAGDLWLSGLRGIHRAHSRELNAVADGSAAKAQFISLGIADGMEHPETNGGENQPAGWKSRDGRLWFPTVLGVVVIDPGAIPREENPPKVVIEQVRADNDLVYTGSTMSATASLPLGAGHGHVLEFGYNANTFVAPERARFRYRLIGGDPDWREETSEHTVRYVNLKPGAYRFEVIGANHHNVWSTQAATISFSLAPHFWQTWAFYGLCGVGLVGVAGAVQGYRLRWQHRLLKLEEQRALASERTRIARDLHDDLGTALTGLALELDVAGREANGIPISRRLGETAQRMRGLAERMREVVWTVNPKCDTVSSLASFLEQQVGQFLRVEGLKVRLDFPEDIPDLPLGAEARHQLALSVREALTNVVRHAGATEVIVSLSILDPGPEERALLVLQVVDNGRGFAPGEQGGQGLANMRARIEQVGGKFECGSSLGKGTVLTFRLPLPMHPAG